MVATVGAELEPLLSNSHIELQIEEAKPNVEIGTDFEVTLTTAEDALSLAPLFGIDVPDGVVEEVSEARELFDEQTADELKPAIDDCDHTCFTGCGAAAVCGIAQAAEEGNRYDELKAKVEEITIDQSQEEKVQQEADLKKAQLAKGLGLRMKAVAMLKKENQGWEPGSTADSEERIRAKVQELRQAELTRNDNAAQEQSVPTLPPHLQQFRRKPVEEAAQPIEKPKEPDITELPKEDQQAIGLCVQAIACSGCPLIEFCTKDEKQAPVAKPQEIKTKPVEIVNEQLQVEEKYEEPQAEALKTEKTEMVEPIVIDIISQQEDVRIEQTHNERKSRTTRQKEPITFETPTIDSLISTSHVENTVLPVAETTTHQVAMLQATEISDINFSVKPEYSTSEYHQERSSTYYAETSSESSSSQPKSHYDDIPPQSTDVVAVTLSSSSATEVHVSTQSTTSSEQEIPIDSIVQTTHLPEQDLQLTEALADVTFVVPETNSQTEQITSLSPQAEPVYVYRHEDSSQSSAICFEPLISPIHEDSDQTIDGLGEQLSENISLETREFLTPVDEQVDVQNEILTTITNPESEVQIHTDEEKNDDISMEMSDELETGTEHIEQQNEQISAAVFTFSEATRERFNVIEYTQIEATQGENPTQQIPEVIGHFFDTITSQISQLETIQNGHIEITDAPNISIAESEIFDPAQEIFEEQAIQFFDTNAVSESSFIDAESLMEANPFIITELPQQPFFISESFVTTEIHVPFFHISADSELSSPDVILEQTSSLQYFPIAEAVFSEVSSQDVTIFSELSQSEHKPVETAESIVESNEKIAIIPTEIMQRVQETIQYLKTDLPKKEAQERTIKIVEIFPEQTSEEVIGLLEEILEYMYILNTIEFSKIEKIFEIVDVEGNMLQYNPFLAHIIEEKDRKKDTNQNANQQQLYNQIIFMLWLISLKFLSFAPVES